MRTEITDLLNIDHPIFQGAMAWVADADLASAVSNAGGLGVIGTGHDTQEMVQKKVEKMFNLTDKPFAVNVMLLNPHVDEVVDYLVESGVKIITTGAGNPGKYMDRFDQAGISVIPVVASVALAKRMERIGCQAVIVEGMEAGGHIGKATTMALLPQVVKAVGIPVIAAGGFGNGQSLAAAIMLGASGIQVGTRFAVSKESNAHENFKKLILKANDLGTVVTGHLSGHPVRVLKNQLSNAYMAVEKEQASSAEPDFTELNRLGKGALKKAVVDGNIKEGSFMAGQVAGLIDKEETVEEMILDYVNTAKKVYQQSAGYFE